MADDNIIFIANAIIDEIKDKAGNIRKEKRKLIAEKYIKLSADKLEEYIKSNTHPTLIDDLTQISKNIDSLVSEDYYSFGSDR